MQTSSGSTHCLLLPQEASEEPPGTGLHHDTYKSSSRGKLPALLKSLDSHTQPTSLEPMKELLGQSEVLAHTVEHTLPSRQKRESHVASPAPHSVPIANAPLGGSMQRSSTCNLSLCSTAMGEQTPCEQSAWDEHGRQIHQPRYSLEWKGPIGNTVTCNVSVRFKAATPLIQVTGKYLHMEPPSIDAISLVGTWAVDTAAFR